MWSFLPRRHINPPRIASEIESLWWELHAAVAAFGLHVGYIRRDVEAAFRRLARSAHPDTGGTLEEFQSLVAQRDLLLKHLSHQGPLVEGEPAFRPLNGESVPSKA